MNIYNVIKQPLVTEKSTQGKEGSPLYIFRVDSKATKIDVRRAIEGLFKVKVDTVRTMMNHGKRRRVGRGVAVRPDWKKAIVSLKEGKIEIFEGV